MASLPRSRLRLAVPIVGLLLGSIAFLRGAESTGVGALPIIRDPAPPAQEPPPAGEPVDRVPVAPGLAANEVEAIVVQSLTARQWQVRSRRGNRVVGYLNHRGIEATITFVIAPETIAVFCEGFRVNRQGERVRPEQPEGWIANLKKDITTRMNARAAGR